MRVGRNVNHHFFPLSSLLFRDGGNWCVTCRRLYWRVGYSIVCSRRCIGITVAGSGVSITACPTCSRRGATIIRSSLIVGCCRRVRITIVIIVVSRSSWSGTRRGWASFIASRFNFWWWRRTPFILLARWRWLLFGNVLQSRSGNFIGSTWGQADNSPTQAKNHHQKQKSRWLRPEDD